MTTAGERPVPVARRGGSASRLTPESVRRVEFGRTPLGRRGYLEADVERFRLQTIDEMSRANAEKAELREEIDRLRNYFRRQGVDPWSGAHDDGGATADGGSGLDPSSPHGPSVQAVNLLSQAQQAADQHIAQAENYTRQLLGNARTQYEQILLEAHHLASEAAEQAARAYHETSVEPDTGGRQEEIEAKLAYMRTFAQVTQVQMRSILDALRQELDALTEVHSTPMTVPVKSDTPFPRPRH